MLQECIGVESDGLIGIGTLRAVSEWAYNQNQSWNPISGEMKQLEGSTQFFLWNSLDVPISLNTALLKPDHPMGLDLHPFGNFSHSTHRKECVIVHWGGLNPAHLHRVFSNRKASSHFAIGVLDGTSDAVIMQFLDAAHIAWHSKGSNTESIGIDICQQPETKWLGHYKKRGYDVKVIKNPAPSHGPAKVLSLDSRLHVATREFLLNLTEAMDIEPRFASSPARLPETPQSRRGILGHSNVDFKGQGKWDVAPWWDTLQEDLVFS